MAAAFDLTAPPPSLISTPHLDDLSALHLSLGTLLHPLHRRGRRGSDAWHARSLISEDTFRTMARLAKHE